ncbi:MAG: PD-(D/E)XK nuclease family protein, partial [Microgenomates group bacterium]
NKTIRQMIKLPAGIIDSDPTKEDKNADERRLFYVALTRAKQEVYLSGATTYTHSAKMIFPAMFLSDLPKEHLKEIKTEKYEKNAPQILADLLTPAAPTVHDDEEEYLKEIIANFKLSPTALNTYLQCHYKFKLDNLYRIPRAKAPAMCFGTAVHVALENLYRKLAKTGKLETKKEFISDFGTALKREVLSESELKDHLVHGKKILSAYYDHYRNEFKPPLFTEKNFGYTNPILLDDISLSGKSDRVDLINKKNKAVRFIDYKTGAPKTRGVLEKEADGPDGNYKRQLIFYNLLGELDRSFAYRVGETELEFIEPDKSNVFHRERFNITPAEVEQLKQTIRQSIKEIRALNFSRTKDVSICARCDFKNHCWPGERPSIPEI